MLCGVALRTVSRVGTAFVGLDRRGEAMVDQTMLDIVILQLDGTEGCVMDSEALEQQEKYATGGGVRSEE